jgi:glycosyltransferase involved in cell wall biosynthesis
VLLVLFKDTSGPYHDKTKNFLESYDQVCVKYSSLDKSSKIAEQISAQFQVENEDLIISQSFSWISDCVSSWRLGKKCFHVEIIHQDSEGLYSHARRVVPTCDLFLAVSNRIAEKLKRLVPGIGKYHIPVLVCPGGVVIKPLVPRPPLDVMRLCYVGRLDPLDKRIFDLVDLTEALLLCKLRFRLTVIGGGGYYGELESRFRSIRAESVVTLTGNLPRQEVLTQLGEHHIFVLPSAVEGFSLALCEAMSQGLVPVVTRVSGTEDIIIDGQNGFLVGVGSIESMKARICELAANHEHYHSMSHHARETAVESMQMRPRVDSMKRAIEELSASPNSVHPSFRDQAISKRVLDWSIFPNGFGRAARKVWRACREKPLDIGPE